MARIWQSGFELNSVTADVEFSAVSGTASISSTTVRTGGFAGRTNPAAATGFFRQIIFAADSSTVVFFRAYLRIATAPGASSVVMRISNNLDNVCAQLQLTSTRTLILQDAGSTPVGSASAALNLNQWYRVELKLDAAANPGTIDARIDGVSFASGANSAQSPWRKVIVGPVTAATTCDLFWDDLAVNDTTGTAQNSWPDEGQIIHLVPASDGDAHAWGDTTNVAGTANNFTLVDEAPPNDATDLVQSVTLNAEDMYNITDPPVGGVVRINCVTVGTRYRNNVADATTAAKTQIRKAPTGTTTQGPALIPNSTTFVTNANAQPRNYPIVLHNDPDGAPWTPATLTTTQIGHKITAAGTNRFQVTAVWASVDYTPIIQPVRPRLWQPIVRAAFW